MWHPIPQSNFSQLIPHALATKLCTTCPKLSLRDLNGSFQLGCLYSCFLGFQTALDKNALDKNCSLYKLFLIKMLFIQTALDNTLAVPFQLGFLYSCFLGFKTALDKNALDTNCS